MKESYFINLKSSVIKLRKQGKSYNEICKILDVNIPKSTLSNWCQTISLSKTSQQRIQEKIKLGSSKGRAVALEVNRIKREKYIENIRNSVKYLSNFLNNKDVAKISLAMLYLGEGSKKKRVCSVWQL